MDFTEVAAVAVVAVVAVKNRTIRIRSFQNRSIYPRKIQNYWSG
jgi:hypothetical protein